MNKTAACAFAVIVLAASHAWGDDSHGAAENPAMTPEQALTQLTEGNERFVAGVVKHPRVDQDRRCLTNAGQHPFAAVLSCSDSRAPVEILFDQGVGDLFVVRVAGNVADTDEIATIEYGVGHLHAPLILVLGHAKCGAVTAVVDGASLHGNLALLTDNIKPAADAARHDHPDLAGAALVSQTIDANVRQSIADLLTGSEEIRAAVDAGKVRVVGAVYDIHSGEVRWLGEHPQQTALLKSASPEETGEPKHHAPDTHQDEHAAPADSPSHDAHSDAQGATAAPHKRPLAASQEYVILAAFLAGSGTASGLVLRLLRKRNPEQT